MLYKLLLEPKVQKLTPMGPNALELAVVLGHLTVALSGHINQVFSTTNKSTHPICLPNRSPYLGAALRTIFLEHKVQTLTAMGLDALELAVAL